MAPTRPPELLVLAGPTAAGKTALSLELARRLDGEIVSADSRQVYRGLDIGTAKASPAERAGIAHHLIDVVDPGEPFDVARFVALAAQAIAAIVARGRRPLVVGGTGLYLRALCGGLVALPGRDAALRAQLEAELDRAGAAALHDRLAAVDPVSASRLPVNDTVRVIRALEVFARTGQPLSAHQQQHGFAERPYRACWIVVDRPRDQLEQRIAARSRAMFDAGLIDEAVALRQRHGALTLLDTLGYREALAVADGRWEVEAAIEQTRLRTRRYAKRQRTWLRREPVTAWLEAPSAEQVEDALCHWRAAAAD